MAFWILKNSNILVIFGIFSEFLGFHSFWPQFFRKSEMSVVLDLEIIETPVYCMDLETVETPIYRVGLEFVVTSVSHSQKLLDSVENRQIMFQTIRSQISVAISKTRF